jgi:hypothetical protein
MSDIDPQADRDLEDEDRPSPETEEAQEKADEALDEARDAVARAEATLHDQILAPKGGEDIEDEEHLDRRDTRGAWPNWSKK